MVGAVVARGSTIVAEGHHASYGGPHAEVVALSAAGARAQGADLYVTLEPCATQGKTPPCTLAVARAGIARIILGARDPSVRNGGQGIAFLRAAGIPVVEDVEAERARELIEPFVRYQTLDRPHVVLKWAMTWDGKIAAHTGDSRWISGEASRVLVHEERARADAVLVGIGTVARDDPSLTCRAVAGKSPVRVVLDPELRIDPRSQLVRTAGEVPTWIYTSSSKAPALGHAQVIVLAAADRRQLLAAALRDLRSRGVHRLLVEGGAGVFTSLLELGAADQVMAFVAPKLLGSEHALTPFEGQGIDSVARALALEHTRVRQIGRDVLLRGFLAAPRQ
jgi:diaminohydroxyphosphoribosylaminopyrimidine deaminase/5-amino-6-(5-phosphoribosylamino)uracil reductase